jgi:HSP20 family protein
MFSLIPKRHGRNEIQVGPERDWQWGSLARIREDLDQLMERFRTQLPGWSDNLLGEHRGWGCEVEDLEDEYVYRLEAPGFEPDDLNVSLQGNQLSVKAQRKEESESEGQRRVTSGSYHRMFTLPPGVREVDIEARYHSGVLELHLPKDEKAKGHQIPVKT